MAPRETIELLLDALTAAGDISDFMSDMEMDAFRSLPHSNRILYRAMKNALTELGEAIKGISKDIRLRNPEVNWRQFAGLRDVVVHQYFRIDMDLLHPIVTNNIPHLIKVLDKEVTMWNGYAPKEHAQDIKTEEPPGISKT